MRARRAEHAAEARPRRERNGRAGDHRAGGEQGDLGEGREARRCSQRERGPTAPPEAGGHDYDRSARDAGSKSLRSPGIRRRRPPTRDGERALCAVDGRVARADHRTPSATRRRPVAEHLHARFAQRRPTPPDSTRTSQTSADPATTDGRQLWISTFNWSLVALRSKAVDASSRARLAVMKSSTSSSPLPSRPIALSMSELT